MQPMTVLVAWYVLAVGGSRLGAQPDTEEERAIAAIQKLGGKFSPTPVPAVSLSSHRIGNADLVHLRALPQVQSLTLEGARISDAGLIHLQGLTRLETLNLRDTGITDHGLARLKGLTRLQELDLRSTKITGEGLTHLHELKQLRTLKLQWSAVTDKGLASLKGFVNLQELDLRTKITGAGLLHVRELKQLRKLFLGQEYLFRAKMRDADLVHLQGLDQLQSLQLSKTLIGDEGLAHLRTLTGLRELSIPETAVTDAGLAHLRVFKQLRELDLSKTEVTEEGVAQLREALPTARIMAEGVHKGLAHYHKKADAATGHGTPDAALDAFVQAVMRLDAAAFRKELTYYPERVERFGDSVETRVRLANRPEALAVQELLSEHLVRGWLDGKTMRYPAVYQGTERASILCSSHGRSFTHYYFTRIHGRWYLTEERWRDRESLVTLPQTPREQVKHLVPLNAAITPVDYRMFPEGKPPASTAEARKKLAALNHRTEYDADGKITAVDRWIPETAERAVLALASPKLKALSFRSAHLDDADLEKLAALTELEYLEILDPCQVTDKGLAHLRGLKNLGMLKLYCPYVTDAGLAHLQGLTNLESLIIEARITDAGLVHLKGLTKLRDLELSASYIAGPGLVHLRALRELHRLKLSRNNLAGAGLEHLAALPKLKWLNLADNDLGDAGLKRLQGPSTLTSLELSNNQITDAGLAYLQGMSQLLDLSLRENGITGPGLVHLKGLPRLRSVELRENPLSDRGAEYLIPLLRRENLRVEADKSVLQEVRTLLRTEPHVATIFEIAVSADGKTLVSGGEDATVKVWDVARGKVRDTIFTRDYDSVLALAITADGKRVAFSGHLTIQIWDVPARQELASFSRGWSVSALAFSPDETLLAVGGDVGSEKYGLDAGLWLLDVATGRERAALPGHTKNVVSVAFSADGKTLVSGSRDKTVKVWDVAAGKERATLQGHTDDVQWVALSADGRTLVSASSDKTVKVWDLATAKERATLKGHTAAVLSVAVTADGKTIVSGSRDQTVRVWDAVTGEPRAVLKGHTAEVMSVAITPDGKTAASGGADHAVRFWDMAGVRKATP